MTDYDKNTSATENTRWCIISIWQI